MTDTNEATGMEENIALNLTDVQNAVAAIDQACEVGAYKGWDSIGKVFATRERMVKFLNAAHAHQQQSQATASEDVATDGQVA